MIYRLLTLAIVIMAYTTSCAAGSMDNENTLVPTPQNLQIIDSDTGSANGAKTFAATLQINQDQTGHTIRPELFGTNLQWEYGGDRLIQATESGIQWNNQAVVLAKEAGITSLRFPGGALANTYRWNDGVGALSDRKPGITFGGTHAPSLFGTDELLEMASRVAANLVITVNISAPISEAQDWIRYINHSRDHQHVGRPLARYWEIGNEIYAPNEPGHTTALDYAQTANQFAAEMKRIDPDIKIGAALEISFLQAAWMQQVLPHMTTWNDEVLAVLSDNIDFLSVHFYAPFDKLFSNARLSQLVLAGPLVFSQNLRLLQEALRTHNRSDIAIAVTEYNTFFGDKVKLDERTAEPEAALFQGLMLFEMMRNPDVILANNWSLINNSVFGMIQTDANNQASTRPTYPVFRTLAQQANSQFLSSTVTSPGYTVAAKGNIPQLDHVPYIDAVSTTNLSSGHITINVINRSLDSSSMLTITGLRSELKSAEIVSYSGNQAAQWRVSVESNSSAGQPINIPPFSYTRIIFRPE